MWLLFAVVQTVSFAFEGLAWMASGVVAFAAQNMLEPQQRKLFAAYRRNLAAAKLIGDLPKHPKRTIRVIAFANEEQGLYGGKAYAEKHLADISRHQIAAESDFGAGRIYAFNTGSGNPAGSREASRWCAAAMEASAGLISLPCTE